MSGHFPPPAGVRGHRPDQLPEVIVWSARTDEVPPSTTTVLPPGEREAARRRPERKRQAYALAHVLRRLLLAAVLEDDPATLVISSPPGRRPAPVGRWFHSLSHSGRFVAVAVAPGPVGVDVQAPRPLRHPDRLGALLSPDGPHDEAALLRAWTRWEALAKATGEGMLRHVHPVPEGAVLAAGHRWLVPSIDRPGAYLAVAAGVPQMRLGDG